MVVVQGEALPEVLRQFPRRMEGGQSDGPGHLPGSGVLVVADVKQAHRLAGQEPAALPPLGHAPRHRATQPLRRRAPSNLLTLSSLSSTTWARLAGLARGILPIILSSRLCS